jgi:hypothetical protein
MPKSGRREPQQLGVFIISNLFYNKFKCPKCKDNNITRSPRSFNETIFTILLSALPYLCMNCGNRFYIYGRNYVIKLFVIVMVILLPNIAVFFYTAHHGDYYISPSSTQVPSQLKVEPQRIIQRIQPERSSGAKAQPDQTINSQDQPANPKVQTPSVKPVKFAAYKKFGANWESIDSGLKITHVKEGPLKGAGLMAGDILVSLDGKPAKDEEMLKARDKIVSGGRKKAIISVMRDKEMFYFELQK